MRREPARKTYKPIRETAMSRADLSTLQQKRPEVSCSANMQPTHRV